MDAELLAIGPFSREVVDALCYPPDFYEDTPVGSTVITRVACCNTTDSSKGLAQALGMHPWHFHQHCDIKLDMVKVDLELLAESVEGGTDTVATFLKLGVYGFRFYYMPNG